MFALLKYEGILFQRLSKCQWYSNQKQQYIILLIASK